MVLDLLNPNKVIEDLRSDGETDDAKHLTTTDEDSDGGAKRHED